MEALDLYLKYKEEAEESTSQNPPPLPPLMMAYQVKTAEDYMVKMVEFVKSSELEQTVLVLPLNSVIQLMETLEMLLSIKTAATETLCRMFFFALEVHYGPLSTSKHLHPLIKRVRDLAEKRLKELKVNNKYCPNYW